MIWLIRSILFLSLALCPITISHAVYTSSGKDVYDRVNIACLANVIWHEARGESQQGQLSVALVVLNRATKRNKSICEVMKELKQFSWYAKHPDIVPLSIMDKQLALAYDTYTAYMNGKHEDHTKGATHFSGKHVRNRWTRVYRKTLTEGKHSFYKER